MLLMLTVTTFLIEGVVAWIPDPMRSISGSSMALVRTGTCKSLDLGLAMVDEQYKSRPSFELDAEIADPQQYQVLQ